MNSSVDACHSAKNALPQAPDLLRDLPEQVVPICELMDALSPRERREDPAHVRLLAELEDTHPLLVHRPTMRVIDGVHRLRAAMMRGRTEVTVQTFDGSEADAFVLAVELNVRHGLPLTLRERKAAAQRIIRSHANWSDRAIAERTGLSAKTVGKARKQVNKENNDLPNPCSRVGRDGKARPISSTEGRRIAAALLAVDPEIPLRELSRKSGLSVGTIRNVRKRLDSGQDPVPDRLRAAERGTACCAQPPAGTVPVRGKAGAPAQREVSVPRAAPEHPRGRTDLRRCHAGPQNGPGGPRNTDVSRLRGQQRETAAAVQRLLRDPSLRATECGRRLLRMLVATELERPDLAQIAKAVPAHCVPLVRALALKRSEDWTQFACWVSE